METSNKHKPLQHRDSLYRDTCTIPLIKNTGRPPRWLESPENLGKLSKK